MDRSRRVYTVACVLAAVLLLAAIIGAVVMAREED